MESDIDINNTHLITLKKNEDNMLNYGYKRLKFPVRSSVNQVLKMCDNPDSSLRNVIYQLKRLPDLDSLVGSFSYCEEYTDPSGKLIGWIREKLISCLESEDLSSWSKGQWYTKHYFFKKKKKIIEVNKKIEELENDIAKINEKIRYYKSKGEKSFWKNIKHHESLVKEKVERVNRLIKQRKDSERNLIEAIHWTYTHLEKAASLDNAYGDCEYEENILAYSHRKRGWSQNIYVLNENFSYQFNTNFGFGNASYFYLTLYYKNILITPFSEWINYDYRGVSEIMRYSKTLTGKTPYIIGFGIRGNIQYKPVIENDSWINAMSYLIETNNTLQQNEQDFVEKYIIKECEEMVYGIEDLMNQEYIHPIGWNNKPNEKGLDGHYNMDYKLEKISGALDFINRIMEFEGIMDVYNYIGRIERINKTIEPIIEEEIIAIDKLLPKLSNDLDEKDIKLDKIRPKLAKSDEKVRFLRLDMLDSNIKYRKTELDLIEKRDEKNQSEESLIHITKYLNKKKDEYEKTFGPLYDEIKKLKEEKNKIEKSLKKIINAISDSERTFEKLKRDVDFDEYDVEKVDKKIKQLEKKFSEAQIDYDKIENENNKIKEERKKIYDEIRNLGYSGDTDPSFRGC